MVETIKISQLPLASSLTGEESIPVVQSGATLRSTVAALAQLVTSGAEASAAAAAASEAQAAIDEAAATAAAASATEDATSAEYWAGQSFAATDDGILMGTATPLASLLIDYENGFAVDFTNAIDARRAVSRSGDTFTAVSPDGILTNTVTSAPPLVIDSSGNRIYTPHNYYLNSAAPATQTVTVVVGYQYTVSVVGSGSLTLSDAATGSVTAGSSVTFTAASTSLVSTLVGSLTRIHLNEGPAVVGYLATTSAARIGVPISKHPTTDEMCLLAEPARTNSLLNSLAPVTQTASLAAGTYTLWIEGAGSVALSGGPTGTATEGSPVTFVLGGTTSVTFTITGTVTFFQCENGAQPTSAIVTYGAARGRSLTGVELALASVPALGSEWLAYFDFIAPSDVTTADRWFLNIHNGTSLANYSALRVESGAALMRLTTASVNQFDSTLASAVTANTRTEVVCRYKADEALVGKDGGPIGSGAISTATLFTPTTVQLGQRFGSGPAAPLYIRRFAILPTPSISVSNVTGFGHTYTTDSRAYDVFLCIGQSNVYTGAVIDPVIDVSGGRVFQLSQIGVRSAADEPLLHPVVLPNHIGFPLAFARDYYLPGQTAPRNNVLLLPSAVGNTGFSDNRWNPGDDLFNRAVSMARFALSTYPNARLRGLLWMQGEREAAIGWTQVNYAAALDAMITGFRAELGEVPFIVGGMRPGWLAVDAATRGPVQAALVATPSRVYWTAYANPSSPTVIGGGSTDVHYDATEQRAFAERWWDAWETL
jgi:hypothetical protein